MTAPEPNDPAPRVWAATWVPGACPVEAFGVEDGYAVAWVQVPGGPLLQVLVDGAAPPAPGTPGRLRTHVAGEQSIDVFTPDGGAMS